MKDKLILAHAVSDYCAWATDENFNSNPELELAKVTKLVANLIAAACSLGWEEGNPAEELEVSEKTHFINQKASQFPIKYYSEIFNNLVLPSEEPVTGNLVDDLLDIYLDLYPGLDLYNSGNLDEANDHWQFWFQHHWGEHATSALRAMWCYLANREASEI